MLLATHLVNYKRAQVVLINNTTNISDEQGGVVPIAALHIQKLISWMLIPKWIPAKTLQGTKAECDTVPATVPTPISSVLDILATFSIKHQGAELSAGGFGACTMSRQILKTISNRGLNPVITHSNVSWNTDLCLP